MRKLMLAGLSALALGLAGCGQNASEPPTAASESADATPESAPGITLTDAVVRLPVMAGSPGAAYFTVSQGSGAPRRIAGVYVEGAERAEMHETVTENGVSSMKPVKDVGIEPGKTVEFKPGGMHVMLFDIADTLKVGGTTEVTITLDNGDKASVPARIEALGGMSGMDHNMSKM
jgi:copper(I)-binding protein